jgi:choline transport protein
LPSPRGLLTATDQLYGLIFIGSSTAFSAMISAAIVFLQTSCVIPQAILLYRGRDRVLPERYFNLGRLGPVINATAVVWVVFLNIIYCVPTSLPVTPQNMSYVSVVCFGLVGFVVILWFTTKKGVFKGPQVDYDLLRERREAAIHVGSEFVEVDSQRRISRGSVGFEAKEAKEAVLSEQ